MQALMLRDSLPPVSLGHLRAPLTAPPTPPGERPVGVTPARVLARSTPGVPEREFRGSWMATVKNIDWPSRPGMRTADMKAELQAMLDQAQALKLNAVIMQVRPAADALYQSRLEPWSEFLTGSQGQAPDDGFDPLAYAVEQAHLRGLELHAWFNPFRARLLNPDGSAPPTAANHITRTQPQWVRRYGAYQWLDPGEAGVQDHAMRVIRDVVKRYDLDGVHIDDYFYPYPVQGKDGKDQPFPDEPSWQQYLKSGGTLSRDDWRRDNVDRFVARLYREVREEKPHVKVGISPFGIWKPGYPPGIKGMDPTEKLYADARKWLHAGWLDYMLPQLYWPIEQAAQSFPKLLAWWSEQNLKGRHMWAGMYTSKVADGSPSAWKADQIRRQIDLSRTTPGVSGHAHYSLRPLLSGRGGLASQLKAETYPRPALVPASPWLDANGAPPAPPELRLGSQTRSGGRLVSWRAADDEAVSHWIVARREGEVWRTEILPGYRRFTSVPPNVDALSVAAVDRAGVAGPPVSVGIN
ncbi:MAG: family 10 glycosylhydrolase [Candidatus Sericytochromatia bacterium]|nr:family 10 glycosylhydrolase [Candidatus Sericytochromatia bacterium]